MAQILEFILKSLLKHTPYSILFEEANELKA